jgi:hypothetical protein
MTTRSTTCDGNTGLRIAAVALWLLAGDARAVTQLDQLTTSPDVTAVLHGQVVADENALAEDLLGGAALAPVAGIPSRADLVALEDLPGGGVLFSVDVAVVLPGSLTVEPRDVIQLDPASGSYTLRFDGSAAGVPDGVRIDALATNGAQLLLSFDTTVALGGLVAADHDVVSFDPIAGAIERALEGSAAGIDAALDVDGAHHLASGHWLLSFDAAGSVGGVPFDDEDVLELDPATGGWEMAYDGTLADAAWAGADLDAVSAVESGEDGDGDGVSDAADNCPLVGNPGQEDRGGVGVGSPADGIGDACQCGDVTGDGRVTPSDAAVVQRSLLVPPTATLTRPELCDVGAGSPNPATLDCSISDAVVIRRALLSPPTASIGQTCPAADGIAIQESRESGAPTPPVTAS